MAPRFSELQSPSLQYDREWPGFVSHLREALPINDPPRSNKTAHRRGRNNRQTTSTNRLRPQRKEPEPGADPIRKSKFQGEQLFLPLPLSLTENSSIRPSKAASRRCLLVPLSHRLINSTLPNHRIDRNPRQNNPKHTLLPLPTNLPNTSQHLHREKRKICQILTRKFFNNNPPPPAYTYIPNHT